MASFDKPKILKLIAPDGSVIIEEVVRTTHGVRLKLKNNRFTEIAPDQYTHVSLSYRLEDAPIREELTRKPCNRVARH